MTMDIYKRMSITLTEQDVKEIIAEYVNQFTGFGHVTADNVELVVSSQEVGPPMAPYTKTYFKECVIKVEG